MKGRWFAARGLPLVLVATALAYLPALGNGFTNWDDPLYVTGNPLVREWTWPAVARLFASFQLGNYHPLTLLSLALQHRVFGLDAQGYHAVNVAIHVANTALVFRVVALLGGSATSCAATALLFGLHPMHVESVAWAAEHKDVLSAFFFLGALVAYLRYRPGESRIWYGTSLGLLLCALLAKAMAVTFPLVLVLCDRLRERRPDRVSWAEKAPFFALAAVFGVLALLSQASWHAIRTGEGFRQSDGLFLASHGLVFYVAKVILPVGLSALYPLFLEPGGRLPLRYVLSPLAAAAVIAAAWRLTRGSPRLAFGALFFGVTLLPVLQLVPLGAAFAADRYVYLPSLGLFFMAGEGLSFVAGSLAGPSPGKRAALSGIVAATAAALFLATWQRAGVWRDSLTLWDDVIAKYPRTSSMAYAMRGDARLERGEPALALEDFSTAVKLNPLNAKAFSYRGEAWLRIAETAHEPHLLESAKSDLDRAVALAPADAAALLLRGRVRSLLQDLPGALTDLDRAQVLAPADPRVYLGRGEVHRRAGSLDRALADFSRAVDLDPHGAEAAYRRGDLNALRGEYALALADLERAAAADPARVEVHYLRGNVLVRMGDAEGAVAAFGRALSLDPAFAAAWNNRGAARAALGDVDGALADFSRALAIDPAYDGARFNRGRLLEQLGRAAAGDRGGR